MNAPHLSVRNVGKAFGNRNVLSDVSLDVHPGELLAILGPSGCGKSTLLRIVAGLLRKDRGSVAIAGRDMDGVPPRERNIGFVFQDYALFPGKTVQENVSFGLRVRGVSESERNRTVSGMLDLVGLSEDAGRPVEILSGGQRQRVALARALAVFPSLLLLDEPLSALDVQVRARLRREIAAVQKKVGIAALFVTHDQQEAMELGDRIAVMHGGHIEQIAPPRELYRSPATEFVAHFIGEVNVLPGKLYRGYAYAGSLAIRLPPRERKDDGDMVKVILRPEDVVVSPPGITESGETSAQVRSVFYLGTHLRLEMSTFEGYAVAAVLPRSHKMADTIATGDAVRLGATGGSILPDPFAPREPEYFL